LRSGTSTSDRCLRICEELWTDSASIRLFFLKILLLPLFHERRIRHCWKTRTKMSVICEAFIPARSQHLFLLLHAAFIQCSGKVKEQRRKTKNRIANEACCGADYSMYFRLSLHFAMFCSHITKFCTATKSCFACSREWEKWKMFLRRLHRYKDIKICNNTAIKSATKFISSKDLANL